jgi:hypothetical protein
MTSADIFCRVISCQEYRERLQGDFLIILYRERITRIRFFDGNGENTEEDISITFTGNTEEAAGSGHMILGMCPYLVFKLFTAPAGDCQNFKLP